FSFSKIDTAISRPSKSIAVTRQSFSHTILKLRSKCMCFPLQTIAFRGHGLSLLALAKGMSTLFAKNGFSRPSLGYSCGVFGHVLFPQMFSVGRAFTSNPSPEAYEMSLDELEHLSKFNDGNTASAFICCSRTLCCNIGMLFSKFLYDFSKCACSFSVDNGYFLITGEQGIIHIFF